VYKRARRNIRVAALRHRFYVAYHTVYAPAAFAAYGLRKTRSRRLAPLCDFSPPHFLRAGNAFAFPFIARKKRRKPLVDKQNAPPENGRAAPPSMAAQNKKNYRRRVRMKVAFSWKILFLLLVCMVSGSLYAENRTGKVVHIESSSAMGGLFKYVYIDSNNDKIVDAILFILGSSRDSDVEGAVLFYYIKNGSTIVYNFNLDDTVNGVFLGESDKIISIDGIEKTKFFPYKK
jgi:hypothetical protein